MPKVEIADEELRKQSNGDKYFVLYANETKMKNFKTKRQAEMFVKHLERGK